MSHLGFAEPSRPVASPLVLSDRLLTLAQDADRAGLRGAALRLLEAHPEVALLFTDVIMPEVNGRKLADEALRRRPGLKVLFTTGYSRNAIIHNGVLKPGVQLIGKPFTVGELAAKLRAVLGAEAAGAGRPSR